MAAAVTAILPVVFLSEMGDGFNGACGGAPLHSKGVGHLNVAAICILLVTYLHGPVPGPGTVQYNTTKFANSAYNSIAALYRIVHTQYPHRAVKVQLVS